MNSNASASPTPPGIPSADADYLPSTQETTAAPCIGVVGLGHMGQALAKALLEGGLRVLAYDRDPAPARDLQAAGIEPAATLAELAGCDIVVSSLPDDEALAAVALAPDGLAALLAAGALHVSTSTVSPGLSQRLAEAHVQRGQRFVSAAILGNPDLARSHQAFVLMAGAADARRRALPVVQRFSQKVFELGAEAGAASLMKLACNVLTAATLQSMGEVIALLRKAGVDPAQAFEVFTGTLFDGRVHRAYGGKIVEQRYSPAGMAAPLAAKDLRLALAAAEGHAVPMPLAGLVHERLVTLLGRGCGGLDWSALGALAAADAGLGPLPAAAGA